MPRTDYILKLKLMLAIVLAVLCVRSSFAVGYSCFAEVSNANSQVCFATYYDANGNMTRDLNKGISNIIYNLLNLPGEITFSDGRKVKYIYTADGTKVRTTYFDATGSQTLQVDYCGNYILHNGVVDRILTPVGYRSTESSLRKTCLVRVRHCVAHRTLAAALGFGRCRHCKDVCSLVCGTTALDYLRCCRFLSDVPSQLRNICHFDAIDANIAPKHSQSLRRLMLLIIGWSGG